MPVSTDLHPDIVAHIELLKQLAVEKARLHDGGDPLVAAATALTAITGYLQRDEMILKNNLLAPLMVLQMALADLWKGGNPPLFFERSAWRPSELKGGRPVSYPQGQLRDTLAFCAEIMRVAGHKEGELADFIAKKANAHGFSLQPPKPLTQHSITRIQYRLDRDGSAGSHQFLKVLRENWPRPEPFTMEAASRQVETILANLAANRLSTKPPC